MALYPTPFSLAGCRQRYQFGFITRAGKMQNPTVSNAAKILSVPLNPIITVVGTNASLSLSGLTAAVKGIATLEKDVNGFDKTIVK